MAETGLINYFDGVKKDSFLRRMVKERKHWFPEELGKMQEFMDFLLAVGGEKVNQFKVSEPNTIKFLVDHRILKSDTIPLDGKFSLRFEFEADASSQEKFGGRTIIEPVLWIINNKPPQGTVHGSPVTGMEVGLQFHPNWRNVMYVESILHTENKEIEGDVLPEEAVPVHDAGMAEIIDFLGEKTKAFPNARKTFKGIN